MKIAFKNFLQTLRRYKAASLLNVAGLTLAFTAFYIIMVQVWWELGYDRSYPEADRILVVNTMDTGFDEKFSPWIARPYVETVIAASPDIEQVAVYGGWWGNDVDNTVWVRRNEFHIDRYKAKTQQITLPGLDMFGFRTVRGDLRELERDNTVIVARSLAERCGIDVGAAVFVNEQTPAKALDVVGIFDDFPTNSFLSGVEIIRNIGDENLTNRSQWQYYYFLTFRENADPEAFRDRLLRNYYEVQKEEARKYNYGEDEIDPIEMRLTPLTELYFASDIEVFDEGGQKGSRSVMLTLLGVAVLVMVVAFINFVNFFFALIPVRLRAVNIFKVYGAPTSALRFSFLFETVGLVLCSLLLAWYVSFFMASTDFANNVSTSLAIPENLPVAGLVVAVALTMALAAGLYPAFYITSFSPAMAAKGSFAGSHAGRRLRRLLVGVQFTIASGLIICAVFMQRQHAYMMNYDIGFDRENLLVFDVPSKKIATARDAFYSALKSDPQVQDATCTSQELVANYTGHWGRSFKKTQITLDVNTVDWNFLDFMGIEVPVGRGFLRSDKEQENGLMVANHAAKRAYNIELGDTLDDSKEPFVGFYRDCRMLSLYYNITPHVFLLPGTRWTDYFYMKHYYLRTTPDADLAAVKKHIQQCVDALDPEVGQVDVKSFEQELGHLYAKDQRMAMIITAFSLLAVVIALMGVFGIVLFETQHRRREIAVRKVMGATTGEVLTMFNTRYLRIVVACFLLAAPVSIWALQRWLSAFTVRVPLSWWVFALALTAVTAVTALTVTVCIWRAANENPAESIKSE